MNAVYSPVGGDVGGRLITITLNPAIDLTVRLPDLVPGDVHRAEGQQAEAGGKGIGVAAVVTALGQGAVATGWLGEDNDMGFKAVFALRGIVDAMVRVRGATRTNIKLAVASRGDSTDINMPGLVLSAADLAQAEADLIAHVDVVLREGDWCELAGSLPPGASVDVWERIARAMHARGLPVAIDTGGAVLGELLQRLADPARGEVVPVAFIKPNRAELEELVGRALPSRAAVAAAAQDLCHRLGVQQVVVSLGGEGAVMADARGRWQADAPRVAVATTVGAGDALVAGTLHALMAGQALPAAGVFGMACAAARIQRIAPGLPPRAEVDALAAAIQATPV